MNGYLIGEIATGAMLLAAVIAALIVSSKAGDV